MAEEKKTDTTPEANAGEAASKKKKVNEMTLQEIDKRISEVKEKQGGLTSKYARQLLLRKKSLS